MTHTTEQLEAMLAAATPGPWRKSPQDGACVTSARGYIGHFSVTRNIKADTRLIAAAPTVTAELIAAHKRIAEMEGALDSLLDAITASDMVGDRSLTITGPTANLKWLLEAEEEARDALGDAP